MELKSDRAERRRTLEFAACFCWPVFHDVDQLVLALDRTRVLSDVSMIGHVRGIVGRDGHPRALAAASQCLRALELAEEDEKRHSRLLRPSNPIAEFALKPAGAEESSS